MSMRLRLDPFDHSRAGELKVFNRLADDERTVAERKWRAPLKPSAAQWPADAGLFGDERSQCDLFDTLEEKRDHVAPLDWLIDLYRE